MLARAHRRKGSLPRLCGERVLLRVIDSLRLFGFGLPTRPLFSMPDEVFAGSSILGRPWLCLRMETINVDGGGVALSDSHIHMLASSLKFQQTPSENITGHLASKSAGHVNKQALPYCPAPLQHIAVRSMNLDNTVRKLRMERTVRRLTRAKRSLRRRSRQCPREWTMSFAR